jgi:hypothetical protein
MSYYSYKKCWDPLIRQLLDRHFLLLILCNFRLITLSHVMLGLNFFEISFVGYHNFGL